MLRITAVIFTLAFDISALAAEGIQYQPHETILSALRLYMESNFRQSGDDRTIEVAPLDSRLRLPKCSKELMVFSTAGLRESGHMSLGVKCSGEQPWTVYDQVYVHVTRNVVVLRNTVKQGTVITPADVDIVKKDISQLRPGYLSADQAIGRPVRKTLTAGMILTQDHLGTLKLIARGQSVSIKADGASFEVSMPGTALMDGEEGQRIRVRNEVSGRIIEGTVGSQDTVFVSR